jgi:hypothetical protein
MPSLAGIIAIMIDPLAAEGFMFSISVQMVADAF